jgi:glucan 1,6-alpha-glucosidase
MLALRKKYDIIVYGDYEDIAFRNRRLYAYRRRLDGMTLTVVCNFSTNTLHLPLLCNLVGKADLLLRNVDGEHGEILKPYEARVYLGRTT